MPETKPTIYLADYTAPPFVVRHVHLDVDVRDTHTKVHTTLSLVRADSADKDIPILLDGEALDLQSVCLDGVTLNESQYELSESSLTIPWTGVSCQLETIVHLYPEKNTCLMGLYASNGNLCTQCEPHGFRRITYYFDRPDVMSYFTTTVEADKTQYPSLLSNGNLAEMRELADNRHWVRWEDPSLKSAYLFALVAGDFDLLEDTFTTMSGRTVKLQMYVDRGYAAQSKFALGALKRSMAWDEEAFGREYDLDIYMIVAVSDFNFGAMENKGLNIFNTKYVLVDPKTATDMDYVLVEGVIGHEYFHNWSGNRVTLRDWFQITLKEGLTVFRDQSFTEAMLKSDHCRLMEANDIETRQFAEDQSPLAHPIRPASYIEINNFYTSTVYEKGAEVIRMYQTFMGDDAFRKATDTYFARFDGQAVTTDDFLAVMKETYPALDAERFSRWYHQAGTPTLHVSSDYDEAAKRFILTVKQSCPATPETDHKEPFYMPLAMGLLNAEGEHLTTQLEGEEKALTGTRVLTTSEEEQSWTFVNVASKPTPALLRRFSAPVKLDYDYSDDELVCLWLHDSDTYCRNAAKKQYIMRVIHRLADQATAGEAMQVPEAVSQTITALLAKEDKLLVLSHLIALPSKTYLLQNGSGYSVDQLATARDYLMKTIGEQCRSALENTLSAYPVKPFEYSVTAQGHRAIRSDCYGYLAAADVDAVSKQLEELYHAADNMTDVMGVLNAINDSGSDLRERLLADFIEKWRDEPLVVRKWLTLQGMAERNDAVEQVEAIMESDLFDWRNPNIIYGLLGAFTQSWSGFHHAEGKGYALIRDVALRLDKTNPQVASRIARSLANWQPMDEKRQGMMRDGLRVIAETDGISGDLYEIASKSC